MKIKEKLQKIKSKLSGLKSGAMTLALTLALTSALAIPGFCSEGATGTYFDVTAATVEPVTNAITSGLTTLIPIGIGIMATFIAIALIKRVIYSFL